MDKCTTFKVRVPPFFILQHGTISGAQEVFMDFIFHHLFLSYQCVRSHFEERNDWHSYAKI